MSPPWTWTFWTSCCFVKLGFWFHATGPFKLSNAISDYYSLKTCLVRFPAPHHQHQWNRGEQIREDFAQRFSMNQMLQKRTAGHATSLPRQPDHVFRPKNCSMGPYSLRLLHLDTEAFSPSFYLVSEAPLHCRVVVVAKLNNCPVLVSTILVLRAESESNSWILSTVLWEFSIGRPLFIF